ncbi:hypothetical protein Rhopal_007838-T1 [Rhodotorula paludigena]|uniref:Uncharacterized protein n=1 Tax=Rhodotorula paludigena TaxID=86838 RepID=A0AAV5GQR8_9BASI|nr:hypothetical protein Rhopal_007838-T1 [Rhodotorula paludigena]
MSAPPAYTPSTPPAGLRVPCSTDQPVPNEALIGSAPFVDLDGSPVYVASAIMGANAVHPCKVARGLVMVAYGGGEKHHKGRYDILPITEMMEWVDTQYGQIPKGRRPVEGGFEASGQHLFHALTFINEVQVPGKTGEHLVR